jgi:hypothetical protein
MELKNRPRAAQRGGEIFNPQFGGQLHLPGFNKTSAQVETCHNKTTAHQ